MDKVGCAGILVADTFCGPLPALPREGQLLAVEDMPSAAGGCAANVALDLLQFCRARGIATVVDVVIPQNARNLAELPALLPFIDYFLPNDDEARLLTGCNDPADQARAFVKAGAGTAIVTCGQNGCVAATGATCLRAGVFPMPVADPSGAGDAFDAGIVTGLVRGWDLRRSLRYAAALGASAVRAVGTTRGVFTAGEAEAFLAAQVLCVQDITGPEGGVTC